MPTRVAMADPTGEALRLDFDRRLLLQFRGSTITSDAGLLAYREPDDTLQLTDTTSDKLADARTGKNGRHRLPGLLRQLVFGRLAGYEDVNDAERLCHDPAMRWVVGYRAIGVELAILGKREGSTARLKEALAACNAALEVFIVAKADYMVALTQQRHAEIVALLEQLQKMRI